MKLAWVTSGGGNYSKSPNIDSVQQETRLHMLVLEPHGIPIFALEAAVDVFLAVPSPRVIEPASARSHSDLTISNLLKELCKQMPVVLPFLGSSIMVDVGASEHINMSIIFRSRTFRG
jgi:hypothetical protein